MAHQRSRVAACAALPRPRPRAGARPSARSRPTRRRVASRRRCRRRRRGACCAVRAIVNVRIATASSAASRVAVDPADRAAVDAAAHGLEVLDGLQDARLRRAGDRRGRERRPHERAEPDVVAQAPRHRAHEVVQAGVRFDRAQRRHRASSPASHTRPRSLRARSTIITFSAWSLALRREPRRRSAAVPLIGRVSTSAAAPAQEELGRRGDHRHLLAVDVEAQQRRCAARGGAPRASRRGRRDPARDRA